jgi:hypothetical protein
MGRGHIRMERDGDDKQGLCGVAMQPSYPTSLSTILQLLIEQTLTAFYV